MSAQPLTERLRELAVEWFEMCGDIHEPLNEAADHIEALEATQAELVGALAELHGFATQVANGIFWHYRDQPIAQEVEALLAKLEAGQ